jgi:DNA polymerase I
LLIHGDVKGLEVVAAGYLSQDQVLCEELRNGVDLHEENRKRFNLGDPPLGRLTAKKFKFRLIYGGQAFTYAGDPDFTHVSRDTNFWQDVIDEYYNKYKGLATWHKSLVEQVKATGRLVMPTGRIYEYKPFVRPDGSVKWHRPIILNYPVQGLGADLVAIARVSLRKRLIKQGLLGPKVLLQSTVHDSIDIDVDNDPELIYNISETLQKCVADVPVNFQRLFGKEFNLPLHAEVAYGPNLEDLKDFTPNENHRT